jgi:hypothetical protein
MLRYFNEHRSLALLRLLTASVALRTARDFKFYLPLQRPRQQQRDDERDNG